MKKISIVVVDDHQLIREMWRELFSRNSNMEVTGETGRLDEAIELIKNTRPDIVMLDINLAQGSGFDAVPLIKKFSPGTKIIAVSMHSQPVYARRMLQLGAKGYVTKNSSKAEMMEAIQAAMQNKTFVCSEIKEIISRQVLHDEPAGPDVKSLSLREIDVINGIKKGLSSKEIAADLSISVRTVEVHRHNILRKLQLKNAAALINFINTTDLGI